MVGRVDGLNLTGRRMRTWMGSGIILLVNGMEILMIKVCACAWSPAGSIASGSRDSTARIWTIADATSRSSLQNGHSSVIVLKHVKGKTNEKNKDVTTLDWNLEDWDDKEYIPDPEDKKPEGYDDIPKEISDPGAKKPKDWDDEEDGEWTPPTTANHACLPKRKCINYNFTKKSCQRRKWSVAGQKTIQACLQAWWSWCDMETCI
ncbi:calnexin homolog 1-like isoform X1 [Actinidia eriantha]|uniref:calnexin homolog 1-like isoform X1 n=1 Tax=Actinidia eriantha TaxID=165200 RepID=UPI0025832A74|nr:calnexin homolog 1-like isoform X1 [Actinidia eriantha]XP_057470794.1 calnexin homolog 1-like isoform X1 [Actinidia eriantha]